MSFPSSIFLQKRIFREILIESLFVIKETLIKYNYRTYKISKETLIKENTFSNIFLLMTL